MIQAATREQHPRLLDLQVECIRGLGDTYSQQQIGAWVEYLNHATSERYAAFQNAIWVNEDKTIDGFVSWSENPDTDSAAIECLYVQEAARSMGIGRALLSYAENNLKAGIVVETRSTLNAQSFYERNGYKLQEQAVSRAGFPIAILSKAIRHKA